MTLVAVLTLRGRRSRTFSTTSVAATVAEGGSIRSAPRNAEDMIAIAGSGGLFMRTYRKSGRWYPRKLSVRTDSKHWWTQYRKGAHPVSGGCKSRLFHVDRSS